MKILAITQCDHVAVSSSYKTPRPFRFFSKQERLTEKLKITGKCFRQSSSAETVETSFEIADTIAKKKKPLNIDETLI